MIERIVPDLTVTDLSEAVRQHTEILGLQVVMDLGWIAILSDDAGHQLILMTTDASAAMNPDVSVFVDDVHAANEAAVSSGADRAPEDRGGVGRDQVLLPRPRRPGVQCGHSLLTARTAALDEDVERQGTAPCLCGVAGAMARTPLASSALVCRGENQPWPGAP
jgi:hypothetical protein